TRSSPQAGTITAAAPTEGRHCHSSTKPVAEAPSPSAVLATRQRTSATPHHHTSSRHAAPPHLLLAGQKAPARATWPRPLPHLLLAPLPHYRARRPQPLPRSAPGHAGRLR
ncbi:hypothetical protein PVAP13_8KG055584, partial [Panicum virgatum]